MKKLAVFNFVPKFCPNCGEELSVGNPHNISDYVNGLCSHTCDCGLGFGKASDEEVLSIQEDLMYYYGGEFHNE